MAAVNPYLEDAPSATNPYLELDDNPYLKLGAEPSLTLKTSEVLGEMPAFVRSPDIISGEQAEQEGIPEGVPTYQSAIEPLVRPLVDLPRVTGRELELTKIPELVAGAAFRNPLAVGLARKTEKTSAQVLAGLQQATVGAAEFFTSPLGIATLGASKLPKLAQKGVALAFVAQMAAQSPEMVKELAEAFYANDPERLTHAAASLGLNTAFIGGGLKAVTARAPQPKPSATLSGPENRPPPIPPAEQLAAKVEANKELLPLTAQVIQETVKPATPEITPAESARVERINTALEQQRETTGAQADVIPMPQVENGGFISLLLPDGTAIIGERSHPSLFNAALERGLATREQLIDSKSGFTRIDGRSWDLQGKFASPRRIVRLDDPKNPITIAEQQPSQPKPPPPAESEVTTTSGQAGVHPGPGAMTAGELLPEEAFITSIKNAWTDADAARFGLEPVERGERRHWRDTVIPEAEAEILNNPQAAEGIMAKVKADPNYRMQDVETAILLQRKADIINEMNRAKKRLDEAREIKHVENEITEMVRINDLADSLQTIREVSKEAGTPLGQALAARKMLMREDYSLATLVARKASALGRPLEPAELAKIEALEAKIADLEAKLKAGEEAKSQEDRKGQEEQTHDETVKAARREKAKGEPVDSVTEGQNIIDRMKKRVEEGDTAEDLYAFVQKLHENLQRQALDQQGTPLSRVEVVDAIHSILTKDLGLNLPKEFTGTERVPNTSDLISGIGRTTPLTTDTAKLAKLDVREQEQKIGKINRYLNKLAAPKTGPERKKSSAEARQLEKEGRKLAREMGIRVTDPATQLANSLSAIKTRLRNEIEEIDLAIANKKRLVKKDGGVAYDAEVTDLRAQRDAKKADYDTLFPKEPLTEAEQIQRAGKVLDRQIAEVERQLRSGEIFPPGRQPKPELSSAALDAQRARLEALKQERAYARDLIQPKPEIKSSEELALQGWRTRTTHRIADLQERIAKGEFATKKRTPFQPTDTADLALKAELKKIKDEFDVGVNKDRLANRTRAARVWDGVKRTLGSPRQLMSSWDLSAVLRQGGFIAFGHPVRAGKALKPMVDALRSDTRARVEEQKIFDRDNYKNGLYQRAKLYLAPLEGMKPSRAEEVFIPSYAERVLGVQASQRAYVTFLNRLRTDSFDAMVTGFAKRGKGLNDVELRAIANYVNAATGRGNLGKLAAAGEGLSMAFFSPRLVASRFQLIAGEPLMRGSMATRRAIAEEYARFAIGLSAVYGLGALAGAEIETDSRSPDFGKLRFGKTRVDPLMGMAQSTVLISRLITGEKVTARGKELPIRGKVPFGSPDAYEVGADWLRTKFSPIFGAAVTATTGKHPGGELATPGSIAKGLLVPLAWQDVLSVMEEQGVPRGAAIEILSLLGMGVQNYDEQRKVR